MLRFSHRFVREEKGTVVVIIALAFVVLLGFVALAVDVGVVALEKNRLARTLDAVALAGAQELPDSAKALEVARNYAFQNGLDPALLNVTFSLNNTKLTASSDETVELYFAKALGFRTLTINGRAVSKIAPVSKVKDILPIGLDDQLIPLVPGQQYDIKFGSRDATQGWRGILSYPGQSGADDYRTAAKEGYHGVVKIGDIEQKSGGNASGPTIQGINDRIDSSSETWDNYSGDSRRVVIVPLYRVLGNQPTDGVKITGFASVFLERVTGNGTENYVTVRYINHTISGDTDDTISGSYLNSVKLVE